MNINRKLQATMIGAVILVVAINLIVVNVQIETLSAEITKANLTEKLTGDVNSVKSLIESRYGAVMIQNGELTDKSGVPLYNDTVLVDEIKEKLFLNATIFARQNDDFIRISTSILTKEGKRAVGTTLGKDSAAYGSVMNGKTFIGEANILGAPYYALYEPLVDDTGAVIGIMFIGASKAQSIAITKEYKLSSMLMILTVSLISVAIVLVISGFVVRRSIGKPLEATVAILKNISEGDGDLTARLDVSSKDEIGDTARYFNLTFGKIGKLVTLVQGQSATLRDVGLRLSSNMTETAAAINEITANIQSIKNQTINQSASVTETSATMEQISRGIDSLNRLIDEQAANVTESSASVEQMMANIASVAKTLARNTDNIKRLGESSEAGKTVLTEITVAIRQVAKESEGLMEISRVIQNIASQTNLLSMNAAVEAAHAGDSGRGFAVVADEIRKLAESSNSQTKTIDSVLKKIKDSMASIIGFSEDVVSKFTAIEDDVRTVADQEEGIRRAMEEQAEGSKQVLEAITTLNDITQKVQASSFEMLTGSNQVAKESRNMNAITQEITGGMNEMASGAEQVSVAINAVNELSA
ncbi:MAG TPA: methyl-accepting chemotaxis protein, partial [Treponemataceae bacterium]|nr:methyl-accepting chemotaxis protein [Treponemataceae bacterium]